MHNRKSAEIEKFIKYLEDREIPINNEPIFKHDFNKVLMNMVVTYIKESYEEYKNEIS